MTSREQKIWDTVHAWAKHQNPGIPDANLRGLMDDVIGVVESEVQAERRRLWGIIRSKIPPMYFDDERFDYLRDVLRDLFPDGEPKETNPPAGERRGSEL